jgi:hypothetical protein
VTDQTNQSSLFGFQGLDGRWVGGPLTKELLYSYNANKQGITGPSESIEELEQQSEEVTQYQEELRVPRLLFFEEANRIDIEVLLSPLQIPFDRMQQRKDPGTILLGKDEFVLPHRVWRIFAGNSPVADIGRVTQSRPFKRRLSTVIPPDVLKSKLANVSQFKSMAIDLLNKASTSNDPEIYEPAVALLGSWKVESDCLDDLREVLEAIRSLPQVSVTVGLVETLLLRAAALKALERPQFLDLALCQTFCGLLSGSYEQVDIVAAKAEEHQFPKFAEMIRNMVMGASASMIFDLEPIL